MSSFHRCPADHNASAPSDTTSPRVGEYLGGAVVHEVLRATDKSVLALGEHEGHPVVIKALRTDDPFWHTKFDHEVGIYQAFATTPPPVRSPRLVHTEGHTVLVLEHITGHPVDSERYPETPVSADVLDAVVTTVSTFGQWQPPAGVLAPVFDYSDRVARYHRAKLFDDTDRAALEALLTIAGPVDAANHGDPVPSNLLITESGECVLIDYGSTACSCPGSTCRCCTPCSSTLPEPRTGSRLS